MSKLDASLRRMITMACFASILSVPASPDAAWARDPYQSRRNFILIHGVAPAQGLLHTTPKNGHLGRSRSTMTGKVQVSYSIAVQSRFSMTEQTFHGRAQNLDTVAKKNVRVEVLRTPMSGVKAGQAEVWRVIPLGDMPPQAVRQIHAVVPYRNTRSLDWRIRVVHD